MKKLLFQAQTIDFAWTDIKSYEVVDDRAPADAADGAAAGGGGTRAHVSPVFSFEYSRPNKRFVVTKLPPTTMSERDVAVMNGIIWV